MIRNSTAIAVSVTALAAAGCSAPNGSHLADKAGGRQRATILRLATVFGAEDSANVRVLRWFAARAAALSNGRLEVRLVFDVGWPKADEEQQVVRSVSDGRNQLGWIGSGGWDEVGVRSFQGLQAPFLITSYPLADTVAEGPIAQRMLAGARDAGVVGLALVPGGLLHPATGHRPLRALGDFAGIRFQVARSQATDAMLRALGAVPVHLPALSIRHGGELDWIGHPGVGESWMTGNIVLDPGFKTLFANPAALDALDRGQLTALREAARALIAEAERRTPSEQRAAIDSCHRNGIALVTASSADLAAIRRAVGRVGAALRRDATTRSLIQEIEGLTAKEPSPPRLAVPSTCTRPTRLARRARPRPLSLLNGTYHVLFNRADARAFGNPPSDPHSLATLPAVATRILDDGKWYEPSGDSNGDSHGLFATYTIAGNRMTVSMPQFGSVERFTFRRNARGTLYLTPVLPMERGDQWVLAGEPWHRVGPPVSVR
jgi:TRAP-type C4-dicarboxylate transport system substrate-binding protein